MSSSKTILIMDDEEVLRETIEAILETLGFDVIACSDGTQAVEAFISARNAGHAISAMFFDLTVPGGTGGKEAIQEIRKLDRNVAVFVSSGYADDPIMSNPSAYGFTASISKPFRRVDLIALLEQHVRDVPAKGEN